MNAGERLAAGHGERRAVRASERSDASARVSAGERLAAGDGASGASGGWSIARPHASASVSVGERLGAGSGERCVCSHVLVAGAGESD